MQQKTEDSVLYRSLLSRGEWYMRAPTHESGPTLWYVASTGGDSLRQRNDTQLKPLVSTGALISVPAPSVERNHRFPISPNTGSRNVRLDWRRVARSGRLACVTQARTSRELVQEQGGETLLGVVPLAGTPQGWVRRVASEMAEDGVGAMRLSVWISKKLRTVCWINRRRPT